LGFCGALSFARPTHNVKSALCALLCGFSLSTSVLAADANLVQRGSYVATAGDCISCHTRPGGQPFAGGLPFATPFGTVFSANITQDKANGIGSWAEEQFARALRRGIAANGDHLFPVFPYTAYTQVTDEDLHALYAYIKTIRGVAYVPPENAMRFPFGYRELLAFWNRLFLKDARFARDRSQSVEWNRGAYLVNALGHCGACHTRRNLLGGEQENLAFTGGVYQDTIEDSVHELQVVRFDDVVRTWSSSDLTPSPRGIGAWSADDIVAYLKTGHNSRAGAFGPMSLVVLNSTSHLSDRDLHAIAAYLKALKPNAQDIRKKVTPDRMLRGEITFTARCGDCHQATGLGVPRTPDSDPTKVAPPLVGNSVVQAADPATLINVILYGAHERSADNRSWPKMPGFELDFGLGMDDEAIAMLADYVRNSWGNQAGAVDPSEVEKQRTSN
jgi:mono/diheme cytochrome c family protein